MNFFINRKIKHIMYLLLMCIEVFHMPFIFAKSSDTIPIIFVHWGNPDFLKHSLWQAKQFNKRVILLGDTSTRHYKNSDIEWHNIADYSKSSKYFATLYVHISLVPYQSELKCFQRWFALEEFMRINNIPVAFHAESDIMLYCDISKECENFKGYDASLVSELWWVKDLDKNGYKGGMVSYWNAKAIKSFTDYLISYYSNKEKIVAALKNYKKDNIRTHYQDDEPLMRYFANDNKATIKIGEINKIINNALFDFMIWFDQNQETKGSIVRFTMKKYPNSSFKIKDIQWKKGLPYCYSPTLKKYLRFKSLHFQGFYKRFMGNYRVKKNA
jgi:hypothetical protein